MKQPSKPDTDHGEPPAFVADTVIAPIVGLSVEFLRKDRLSAQRIPFMRVGDRCLYDPPAVLAAVRALTVGGATPSRRRGR